MKFLANFDTELETRVVQKYIELYGKDNILCIHRAKIFWVFKCLLPGIAMLALLLVAILIGSRDSGDETLNGIKSLLSFIFGAIVIFVGGVKLLKKYFDYKMDFCVVTPQEVVAYNQTGLLNRSSRTIDADKIKTVTDDGAGFLQSLFNYGGITFLSEGDQAGGGDIRLYYVQDVNTTKNIVRNLIEPHLQKHSLKQHEPQNH
ncbi:MAG: hypothetical protein WC004_01090 [Candidatus Absconditabacterales bacterium]